ncbi:hypothetical protein [Frankia tisae]|uniref:hypothetical protein n=1 Tax=Frankia tisae TaxID=2950104 RepID=UPI0021BEEEE3|nr:hypothetical protein [Frankia tisae]
MREPGRLEKVTDPRPAQGRVYPLTGGFRVPGEATARRLLGRETRRRFEGAPARRGDPRGLLAGLLAGQVEPAPGWPGSTFTAQS